ncbi:MAG: YiiX/YebB-like N1pC/P60 family cysteine hydrolase [Planctomycetota bacterium]
MFEPKEGDLLFQDLDCGPLCDAIEKVTTGYQGSNFSHVGILARNDKDDLVVIEAVSSGIETTDLEDFLNRSGNQRGRSKVMVGRLKKPYKHLIPLAIENGLALKGKPYDKVFEIDNDAYYCSELIYQIFLEANNNNPLFTLQPMTFKDPETGKILNDWEDYFSRLDALVPEGREGINPGSISRSWVLEIVYQYGSPSRKL